MIFPNRLSSVRNTSTDVEKTPAHQDAQKLAKKHLHGRGEDSVAAARAVPYAGNTSTDVEKTSPQLQ